MVKKIVKSILYILFGILSILEAIFCYKTSDPWGITFVFGTIPFGILGVILLIMSIKSIYQLKK